MEFRYVEATTMPYSSIGSFLDFFGGTAYEHLNYIFADVPYAQENCSETSSFAYYDLENYSSSSSIISASSRAYSMECSRVYHNSCDEEVAWQDNVDPDNMTYEELVELGETVGTQSRGLSQQLINLLPVTKFKCCFFSRKRSRKERCVICQMEYKRGDRLINLPCKHAYHKCCGSKWLSINKACPICNTEVVVSAASN